MFSREEDYERMDEVMALVMKIWKENPNLRLCQLINNCLPKGYNLYYVNDADLIQYLIDFYYKK